MRNALARGLGVAAVVLTTVGATNLFWPQIVEFVAPPIEPDAAIVRGPSTDPPAEAASSVDSIGPAAESASGAPSASAGSTESTGPILAAPNPDAAGPATPDEAPWDPGWASLSGEAAPGDAPTDREAATPDYDALFATGGARVAAFLASADGPRTVLLDKEGRVLARAPMLGGGSSRELQPIRTDTGWWLFRGFGEASSLRPGRTADATGVDLVTGEAFQAPPGDRWVHPTLMWAAEVREGDVFLGRYDFATDSIVSPQRVTDTGRFRDLQLRVWSGGCLYLHDANNPAKPTVFVDLMTGRVAELAEPNVSGNRQGLSPDGRFLVQHDGDLLVAYDLWRTERAFVRNALLYEHPMRLEPQATVAARLVTGGRAGGGPGNVVPDGWLDNRTAVFAVPQFGALALLDVTTAELSLKPLDGDESAYARFLMPHSRGPMYPRVGAGRWLIVKQGEHTWRLDARGKGEPAAVDARDATPDRWRWVTPDAYLYEVSRGSLDELGVWRHAIAEDDRRRVWPLGMTTLLGVDAGAAAAYFRDREGAVHRVDLDDGATRRLPDLDGSTAVAQLATPIRLTDEAANAVLTTRANAERVLPTAAAQLADPAVAAAVRCRQIVEGAEPTVRRDLRWFRERLRDFPHHDPQPLLSGARAWLESPAAADTLGEGEGVLDRLLAEGDFADAFRSERAMAWAFDAAIRRLADALPDDASDEAFGRVAAAVADRPSQRIAARTAQLYAEACAADAARSGSASPRPGDQRLTDAYRRARAEFPAE